MVQLSLKLLLLTLAPVYGICELMKTASSNASIHLNSSFKTTQAPGSDSSIQQLLAKMLTDYDPKLRPNYLGPAVNVSVDATVMTISKIDEVNMMYTLDMFFRQRWNDHRLKHNLNETLTLIVGTKQPSDIIWVPDTVFIDSVTSHMHAVTVNNHKIDIKPNGDVFWGTRVTVSPTCVMDLKAYPMDKQKCPFVILSYAYTSRHVKYQWMKRGIIASNIEMAQFRLRKFENISEEITYVAGNYTQLKGIFHFDRLIGYAIMQIYIPSICVVIVSWISLWVNRAAIPARVALCITTLLTISSFWSSINAQLPRVNYVKAIDIFMLTSFTCVIMTLVEFTFVLNSAYILGLFKRSEEEVTWKKGRGHEMSKLLSSKGESVKDSNGNVWSVALNTVDKKRLRLLATIRSEEASTKGGEKRVSAEENLANTIEGYARVFFPLVYAFFLILYFCYFLC